MNLRPELSILSLVAIATLLISGCSDDAVSSKQSEVSEPKVQTNGGNDVTNSEVQETDSKKPDRRAVVSLNGQEFPLDRVFCVPGMAETIIATDAQKRATYPEVKLVDFGDSGDGVVRDQVSFDFRHGEPRVLWQLEEGDVVKDGDHITASGNLRGKRMVKNADGTESSAPLDGNDLKSFTAEVNCK